VTTCRLIKTHMVHCAGTAAGAIRVSLLKFNGSLPSAKIMTDLLSQVSPWGTADGGMNAAVRASILAGIMYLIAAGNSNGNACNFYPTRYVL